MTEHCFGGDAWTERKLDALGRYLVAWRKIFISNPGARYFKTLYVNAFAGTGSRKNPKSTSAVGAQYNLFDADDSMLNCLMITDVEVHELPWTWRHRSTSTSSSRRTRLTQPS